MPSGTIWTDDEWRRVCTRAAELMDEDPNLSETAAVRRANLQVLHPSRQRKVQSVNKAGIPELIACLRKPPDAEASAPATPPETVAQDATPRTVVEFDDTAPAAADEATTETEPQGRTPRVHWTEAEFKMLARKAAEHCLATGEMDPRHLLNYVQKQYLTPSRQRPEFKTIAAAPRFRELYPQALMELHEERKTADQKAAMELIEAATAPPPPPPQPVAPPSAVSLLVDALRTLIIEAIESPRGQVAIRRALTTIEPMSAPPAPANAEPAQVKAAAAHFAHAKAPAKKSKVLIFGLLGSQAETIRKEYGLLFDLRFMNQDDSTHQLKDACTYVDVVIAMIGYINHSHEAVMKKRAAVYKRVNGTVGDLRRVLNLMKDDVAPGAPVPAPIPVTNGAAAAVH